MLTVSERTRADLIRLYELPPGKVVVTPNGVDPVFAPGNPLSIGTYVLAVGAVQPRKNQRAALAAAAAVPLPLVIAGPIKDDVLAEELRAAGADLRGYVPQEALVGLYQGAACLVQPSRFEGFGLPVLEAMACGSRSSRSTSPPCARSRAMPRSSSARTSSSRASRGRSRTASASSRPGSSASRRSAGARRRSGRSRPTGRRSDEGLRGRRLARPRARAGGVAAGARAAGRRAARRRQRAGQRRRRARGRPRRREPRRRAPSPRT